MVKLYNSSPLAGSAGGDPGPRALLAAVDAVEALFSWKSRILTMKNDENMAVQPANIWWAWLWFTLW